MKNLIWLIIAIFMISGCSTKNISIKNVKVIEKKQEIQQIKFLPQDTMLYSKSLSNSFFSNSFQKKMDKSFNKTYFKPWNMKKIRESKKSAMWAFYAYSKAKMYGENHILLPKDWFKKQKENANFNNFNKINKKAITVVNSNLRNFPTNKPIFKDVRQAGEGFPFDYGQNSAIKANSPILISHYSKDRAWAYVQSSFALGWVEIRDIAFVDKKFQQKFQNNKYVVSIKEKFPVYDSIDNFKFYAKVGAIFPLLKEFKDSYEVIIALKNLSGNALISNTKISKNVVAKKPIDFNQINTALIANELLNEPYSWGGLLENRDCSATTKDFFAPFGIWLPRNSKAQVNSNIGNFISLKNLTPKAKEDIILAKAVPFLTIIYLKGHIMLYVGKYNGKPAVLHNAWGIKTIENGKEGRYIIGKTAITSLEPGKGLKGVDNKKSLLNRVRGMRILADSKDLKLFYSSL